MSALLTGNSVSPAVDADRDVIVRLKGAHLIQHVQNGRDRVRHAVIWPVDIVQLFQSAAALEEIGGLQKACTQVYTEHN